MLEGLTEVVRLEGDTAVASDMLPLKPPRPFRFMMAVPDWPAKMVKLVELVETEKSTTLIVTWTEWTSELLVAVMVIV